MACNHLAKLAGSDCEIKPVIRRCSRDGNVWTSTNECRRESLRRWATKSSNFVLMESDGSGNLGLSIVLIDLCERDEGRDKFLFKFMEYIGALK